MAIHVLSHLKQNIIFIYIFTNYFLDNYKLVVWNIQHSIGILFIWILSSSVLGWSPKKKKTCENVWKLILVLFLVEQGVRRFLTNLSHTKKSLKLFKKWSLLVQLLVWKLQKETDIVHIPRESKNNIDLKTRWIKPHMFCTCVPLVCYYPNLQKQNTIV